MDPLGKKGEAAIKRLKKLEQRIEKSESHLKGLDSALQDFGDKYESTVLEELAYHKKELEELRKISDKINTTKDSQKELEEKTKVLESRLNKQEDKLDNLIESDLTENFSKITEELKKTRDRIEEFENRLENVEESVDQLESEFLVEINNREFDFGKKIDERAYKKDRDQTRTEIAKLKAAVNALADDMDKDEIEID